MLVRFLLALTLFVATGQAAADAVLAAHTLRSQSVIGPDDIIVRSDDVPGAISNPGKVIGKEVRANIYAGRPIRPEDIGEPALIRRNQIVTLRYFGGGLAIVTDGRALDRAGVGDRIRVMNLKSRTTVTGTVTSDGQVSISPD